MQYDKQHGTTIVLTAAAAAWRFIGFDGAPATSAGGAHDSRGVSETAGIATDAITLITDYSAPVEAGEAIAANAFVKAAADGSGKAITGTATDYCGRALEAAGGDGSIIEVVLLPVRHA